MNADADFSRWIDKVKQGDCRAIEAVWEEYFAKLVGLARRKLASVPRRVEDEEDVALSALDSFCRGVAEQRFPRLDDRFDLWRLLVTITARKAVAQQRRHYAQKRGAGQVRGESAWSDSDQGSGIDQILGTEPTGELALSLVEQYSNLVGRLDERQRPIALLKTEGFTNREIAERLDLALRTVERRLAQIRRLWLSQADLKVNS